MIIIEHIIPVISNRNVHLACFEIAFAAVYLAVALEARRKGDRFHFGAHCIAAAIALGLAACTAVG